jgi:site-specific DNA-cytosine methylase
MGGLSLGFREAGCVVHGYDAERHAVASYAANVGPAELIDLRTALPDEAPAILVGGPPCRPWSPINLQRRRAHHLDYDLIDRFRIAVETMHPCAFVLENVPFLRGDTEFHALLDRLIGRYVISENVFSYADWGAATRRRRLFALGFAKGHARSPALMMKALNDLRAPPASVNDAIGAVGELTPGELAGAGHTKKHPFFAVGHLLIPHEALRSIEAQIRQLIGSPQTPGQMPSSTGSP